LIPSHCPGSPGRKERRCPAFFFSPYAFHGGLLLPVLGFIFLPLTTIVYAWELNSGMPTVGINLLWLLIAVIIDLGGLGAGAHRQSQRN
jgi:uncharacterized membrane protein